MESVLHSDSPEEYKALSRLASKYSEHDLYLSLNFGAFKYVAKEVADHGQPFLPLLRWLERNAEAAGYIKHLTLAAQDRFPPHRLSDPLIRQILAHTDTLRQLTIRGSGFIWGHEDSEVMNSQGSRHPTIRDLVVRDLYCDSGSYFELLGLADQWDTVEIADNDHEGNTCWNRLREYDILSLTVTHCQDSDIMLSLPDRGGIFRELKTLILIGMDASHALPFAQMMPCLQGTLETFKLSLRDGHLANFEQAWDLGTLQACTSLTSAAIELPLDALSLNFCDIVSSSVCHFLRFLPPACSFVGIRFTSGWALSDRSKKSLARLDWAGIIRELNRLHALEVLFCDLRTAGTDIWASRDSGTKSGVDIGEILTLVQASDKPYWEMLGVFDFSRTLALGNQQQRELRERGWFKWRAEQVFQRAAA